MQLQDRTLREKLSGIWGLLDERARRLVAAKEAHALGYGGVCAVQRACGMSRVTITKGLRELAAGVSLPQGRIRRPGAGRKPITERDPGLLSALDRLIEPEARGDPQSPLRWICQSTRTLARELTRAHHPICAVKVGQLLHDQGFNLQGNRKTEEGDDHPDRDAQFRYINEQVKAALREGAPVISVDTKKKALLGNYVDVGRQWRVAQTSLKVNGHNFPSPDVPRADSDGINAIGRNTGFVNVGSDHDTGALAVASIRGWWRAEGRALYPQAARLVITAAGGGRNGYRLRPWKVALQRLADGTGLSVCVCHFPPGMRKWNQVEQRLCACISANRRDEPRRDDATIVQLIAHTTTAAGRKVMCRLDRRKYATGRRGSSAEMTRIHLVPAPFHPKLPTCMIAMRVVLDLRDAIFDFFVDFVCVYAWL